MLRRLGILIGLRGCPSLCFGLGNDSSFSNLTGSFSFSLSEPLLERLSSSVGFSSMAAGSSSSNSKSQVKCSTFSKEFFIDSKSLLFGSMVKLDLKTENKSKLMDGKMSNRVSLLAAKCKNSLSLELAELNGDFPKTMFNRQIPRDQMSTLSALYVSMSLWSNSSGAM
ncbi:hypothetical protein OGAPHI_005503 [Ogataea philodendri]|uniref:Uncharacterized protein n=1 Tax=Ogataea philodendri TaxID=1378263 RepID=A0A9P8T1T5_9ASCO|nr:uncharacterized protein OGAPHI_005503 [Ogataea philodendri]KAH3662255.1 hypothetical protein OGAPHI_005503 [Ogataea philodendri]